MNQRNGIGVRFASTSCRGVRLEILVSRVVAVSPPCTEGRKQPTSVYRPSLFSGATLRCGKTGHICTATWFSTPHPPKGRISAARLCSSNGKYGSPAASTAESELKGAVTAANETVVTRVKRAARVPYQTLEYIRSRPGGGTRTAQRVAGEPN